MGYVREVKGKKKKKTTGNFLSVILKRKEKKKKKNLKACLKFWKSHPRPFCLTSMDKGYSSLFDSGKPCVRETSSLCIDPSFRFVHQPEEL